MNVNFRIKSTVRIYITGVIFLKFPQITFIRTYVIIPIRIPFEIEYVSGIVMIQMNAGSASEKSVKSIFVTDSIIIKPTRTKAGAVAAEGIERKRGEKNKATAKHPAIISAVSPERPP